MYVLKYAHCSSVKLNDLQKCLRSASKPLPILLFVFEVLSFFISLIEISVRSVPLFCFLFIFGLVLILLTIFDNPLLTLSIIVEVAISVIVVGTLVSTIPSILLLIALLPFEQFLPIFLVFRIRSKSGILLPHAFPASFICWFNILECILEFSCHVYFRLFDNDLFIRLLFRKSRLIILFFIFFFLIKFLVLLDNLSIFCSFLCSFLHSFLFHLLNGSWPITLFY